MTNMNAYETLYNNMKTKFTVINENCEYSLGEYMVMKANEKNANETLPAEKPKNENRSIAAIFSYMNEKLAVKKAPVKDKTIRSFPFRTSVASFLTAIIACALIFSYGIFTVRGNDIATAILEGSEEYSSVEAYTAKEADKS